MHKKENFEILKIFITIRGSISNNNMDCGLEHYTKKLHGLGNEDTKMHEWITNQHRDSLSSYIGHFDMLSFIAVVENESIARVKYNRIKKMVQPCGPPPQLKCDE